MEISKSNAEGLTLGDVYDLAADATAIGLSRDTKVFARCKPEIRFDRPPTALGITLIGDRETTEKRPS